MQSTVKNWNAMVRPVVAFIFVGELVLINLISLVWAMWSGVDFLSSISWKYLALKKWLLLLLLLVSISVLVHGKRNVKVSKEAYQANTSPRRC
jgi:hypothetical protein